MTTSLALLLLRGQRVYINSPETPNRIDIGHVTKQSTLVLNRQAFVHATTPFGEITVRAEFAQLTMMDALQAAGSFARLGRVHKS